MGPYYAGSCDGAQPAVVHGRRDWEIGGAALVRAVRYQSDCPMPVHVPDRPYDIAPTPRRHARVLSAAPDVDASTCSGDVALRLPVQRIQRHVAALAAHSHHDDGLLRDVDADRARVGGPAL